MGCFLLKETENDYPKLRKYIHANKTKLPKEDGLKDYLYDQSAIYSNYT